MPFVNFELPEELHRRARSKAALRGMKFYAYLIEAIHDRVDRDETEDRETGRGQVGPSQV